MVYDYVVTLKNRNSRQVDNISILLITISILFFLNAGFRAGFSWVKIAVIILLVLIVAFNFFAYHRGAIQPNYSKALLVAAIGWFDTPDLWYPGIALAVLAFIEKPAKSNLEIGFTKEAIVMNTLIRRSFSWSEFNNIVLKDDLLTLDFKNNRLIQRQTIEDDPDASEDEFNDYCRRQLSSPVS